MASQHLLPAQGASSVPPSPTGARPTGAECGAWWEDVVHQAGGTWGTGRDASHPRLGSEGSGRGCAETTGRRGQGPLGGPQRG